MNTVTQENLPFHRRSPTSVWIFHLAAPIVFCNDYRPRKQQRGNGEFYVLEFFDEKGTFFFLLAFLSHFLTFLLFVSSFFVYSMRST